METALILLYIGMKLKKVIDHLIASESMCNDISNVKVSEPVTYTGHAPMNIKIVQVGLTVTGTAGKIPQ